MQYKGEEVKIKGRGDVGEEGKMMYKNQAAQRAGQGWDGTDCKLGSPA